MTHSTIQSLQYSGGTTHLAISGTVAGTTTKKKSMWFTARCDGYVEVRFDESELNSCRNLEEGWPIPDSVSVRVPVENVPFFPTGTKVKVNCAIRTSGFFLGNAFLAVSLEQSTQNA